MQPMTAKRARTWLLAAVAAAVLPAGAQGQGITLAAGSRLYDEDGHGRLVAALRSEFPVGRSLILEFASSVSDHADAPLSTASVFEAQLQLPIRLGQVLTPYVGVGGGAAWTRSGHSDVEINQFRGVLSAGVGVRAAITRRLGLTLDARARGAGFRFQGSHTDVTAGLRIPLR